jgi:transcriptional activator SPT7
LQQTNERQAIAHEAMFEDGADGLVAGNFAEQIGDDFFGFKELGLEQELGMQGLSVPSRLFRGLRGQGGKPGAIGPGAGAQAGGAAGGAGVGQLKTSVDGTEVLQFVPPEPFILLDAAGISAQIGLLGAFFREKLREHKRAKSRAKEEVTKEEMENLPDDEDAIGGSEVKKSLRVPPTGKLPKRRMWERPSASASASALAPTNKAEESKGTKSKAAFGGGEKGSRKDSASAAAAPSRKIAAAS